MKPFKLNEHLHWYKIPYGKKHTHVGNVFETFLQVGFFHFVYDGSVL